jgi:hypothetical protein
VLLVFGAPCQLRLLAGSEHGRTFPLPDLSGPLLAAMHRRDLLYLSRDF